MNDKITVVKREMTVTTRWILSAAIAILATAGAFGSYYLTDVATDIAAEKDAIHDANVYAHPAAFHEWQMFQTAETDRIITEIRKR